MINVLKKIGAIGCLTIVLTACGMTPEERAAALKAEAEANKIADHAACVAYGLRPKTDAFALCMQKEDHNRKQLAASKAAEEAANDATFWAMEAKRQAQYGN